MARFLRRGLLQYYITFYFKQMPKHGGYSTGGNMDIDKIVLKTF